MLHAGEEFEAAILLLLLILILMIKSVCLKKLLISVGVCATGMSIFFRYLLSGENRSNIKSTLFKKSFFLIN